MTYFFLEKIKQKLINIKNLYFIKEIIRKNLYFIKEIIRINFINDLYFIRIIMKKFR